MFWLRIMKIIFSYTLLSGGLILSNGPFVVGTKKCLFKTFSLKILTLMVYEEITICTKAYALCFP